MKFIIEKNINLSNERLAAAARKAGHSVVRWEEGDKVPIDGSVFHGSLNACRFMPGVLGSPDNLAVSSWSQYTQNISLNSEIEFKTLGELNTIPSHWDRVFVRPNSPMKEFSGRVLDRSELIPAKLGFGLYYDDENLFVAISPAKVVLLEWRFVSVGRQIVASSGYNPTTHLGYDSIPSSEVWDVAEKAAQICKEPTVVIDVCLTDSGEAKLVEYNLFSGSDLYNCDCDAIVKALV